MVGIGAIADMNGRVASADSVTKFHLGTKPPANRWGRASF